MSPTLASLLPTQRDLINNYQKSFYSVISDPEFPFVQGVTLAYMQKLKHSLSVAGITHKVGRSGIWWSQRGHLLGHLALDATLCDKCGIGLGNPATCASCQRGDVR